MKTYLRVAGWMVVVLGLLLMASPVTANAIRTEVSAKIYQIGSPISPDLRVWYSAYVIHGRNELVEYQYVASDERLSGYALLTNNLNLHYASDLTFLFAQTWTSWTIYAEPSYTTPKWECSDTGQFDAMWNLNVVGVCHGVGQNKGLQAKFTITLSDWSLGYMDLEGEILETGGY